MLFDIRGISNILSLMVTDIHDLLCYLLQQLVGSIQLLGLGDIYA